MAFKEYGVKPINVSAQYPVHPCQVQVLPGDGIIAVPHENAQRLQVAAPHDVTRCERVPAKVRMNPDYAGTTPNADKKGTDHGTVHGLPGSCF